MTKLFIKEGRTPSRRAGEEHWRAALYHAPEDFMTFFFPRLSSKYDWEQAPRFKEDGVMELRARGKRVQWHLYHVRVQFSYEADLVWQVFDDNFWISKENHDRPVGNLVLFADDDPGWRPCSLHTELLGTVWDFSFATAKLLDFAGRYDELVASNNPFAWATLLLLRAREAGTDVTKMRAVRKQLLQLLDKHGWREELVEALLEMLECVIVEPGPCVLSG